MACIITVQLPPTKRGPTINLRLLAGQIKPDPATGQVPSYEAWKAQQAAAGRIAGTPPKPKTPMEKYVDLTAKKILASSGKGPPLTDQENADLAASSSGLTLAAKARADEMASAQAQYRIVPVSNDTGSEDLLTAAQVAAAARGGNPMAPGSINAPTGQDKQHALLAQSAIRQINTMEGILKSDPSLTGPGAGQWTAFTQWLGSNSPDSQQFLAAATFASEHGVGVFGGRNIHSIADLQNLFGSLRTNPAALKAALEQARSTMNLFANAGGRLPGAKAIRAADGGTVKVQIPRPDLRAPLLRLAVGSCSRPNIRMP